MWLAQGEAQRLRPGERILKILTYCKNTQSNKKALEAAVDIARAFNGKVELVSCITEDVRTPPGMTEKAESTLKEYITTYFEPAGIECTSKVILTTIPCGEEIVNHAEQEEVGLIIMGIQKRSKVGKIFFGSTTQFIILEAPCKVLTIK